MLLITRDHPPLNPEHLEEVVVEALRLTLLVRRVPPLLREAGRAPRALHSRRGACSSGPLSYSLRPIDMDPR